MFIYLEQDRRQIAPESQSVKEKTRLWCELALTQPCKSWIERKGGRRKKEEGRRKKEEGKITSYSVVSNQHVC